ncbi:MAG: hypothetical protein Q4C70_07230 [Planctomycetia bacterium]|nr:hypothetical protein [Planctomycetia bacterium]
MKMKPWDVCPECGARRIAVCRFCNTIGDRFPLADLDLVLPPEHAESVAERYNTAEDCYDDGDGSPVVAKSFLADSLGSAFGGGNTMIQSENAPEETVPAENNPQTPTHHCCHGHGEVHHADGHQCCHGHGDSHECQCAKKRAKQEAQDAQNTQNSQSAQAQPAKPQSMTRRRDLVELSHPLDLDPEVAEDAEEYPLAVMCPCCDELLYPQFLSQCRHCGHEFSDGLDLEELGDTVFYRPEDDENGEDDYDDEDYDEGDENTPKHRKGAPEPAGCCLMLLGIITAAIMWF